MKSEETREHKCDRCGFFVLDTQSLHVIIKNLTIRKYSYERLCLKCIKED